MRWQVTRAWNMRRKEGAVGGSRDDLNGIELHSVAWHLGNNAVKVARPVWNLDYMTFYHCLSCSLVLTKGHLDCGLIRVP